MNLRVGLVGCGNITDTHARAIATGGTPPCDGREGLRDLALMEAVYAAARRVAEEVV